MHLCRPARGFDRYRQSLTLGTVEELRHVCAGAGRNEPNVHAVRQDPNSEHWQGSELSVTILGSWQYYRAKARRWHCPVSGVICLVEELSLL